MIEDAPMTQQYGSIDFSDRHTAVPHVQPLLRVVVRFGPRRGDGDERRGTPVRPAHVSLDDVLRPEPMPAKSALGITGFKTVLVVEAADGLVVVDSVDEARHRRRSLVMFF